MARKKIEGKPSRKNGRRGRPPGLTKKVIDNGIVLQLTPDDKRWWENCMLKQSLTRTEADTKIAAINREADELMATIGKREDIDVSLYDFDWNAKTARLKPKAKPKAKTGPQAKEPDQQPVAQE